MKTLLIPIVIVLLAATAAFAGDEPVVPEGVHYKKATPDVNEAAKQKLLRVFSANASDKDVLAFFEPKVLICGPGLWQEIKEDPAVAPMGEGKVTVMVPVLDGKKKPTGQSSQFKGQLFQTDQEVLAFWKAFARHGEFADLNVRKLRSRELEIYWAMISFDITEPVFIVEGKKHQILVQFASSDNLRVAWIDDFANVTLHDQKDAAPEAVAAGGPKPAELNQLRLYIPIPQLEERFGKDVGPLADYIKALEKRASEALGKEKMPNAKGLLIAVGIKSKTKTRIWCQAVDGDVPAELLHKLETELGNVEAVDLKKGPAGFAMEINLFGQKAAKYPEFPDSWVEAARKSETKLLVPPDELFKVIWPD